MLAAAPPGKLPGDADAVKATLIWPLPRVPETPVGAEGAVPASGVTLFEAADGTEVSGTSLVAVTVQV